VETQLIPIRRSRQNNILTEIKRLCGEISAFGSCQFPEISIELLDMPDYVCYLHFSKTLVLTDFVVIEECS
jgi:hypothetical protein